MRGTSQAQPEFLTILNLNATVPADHPLRAIKRHVDAVLQKLSPLFDELYEEDGRPSIPPEPLLKARVLTALYRVRSERLFCEPLSYNLLWFLDREWSEGSFDPSVFAKNYQRVLSADVARLFFAEVYALSRQEGWTSDEHFTADGPLIESRASRKSFVRKDGAEQKKVQAAKDEDAGHPTINFRGAPRRNATHQSTTDPESVLYRKARGQEARLCFGGHILMENRNGLCADFTLHHPLTEPASRAGADAGVGLLCGGHLPSAADGAPEPDGSAVNRSRRAAGGGSGRKNAGAAGESAAAGGASGPKPALVHA